MISFVRRVLNDSENQNRHCLCFNILHAASRRVLKARNRWYSHFGLSAVSLLIGLIFRIVRYFNIMSDLLEHLLVGSCTAFTGWQTGMAIRDEWKRWKDRRRRPITDYERALEGETRHGCKVVIPRNCLWKKYLDFPVVRLGGYYRFEMWMIDPQERLEFPSPTSIMIAPENPSPYGGSVYMVRQCSLIDPRMSSTILDVVFDEPDEWSLFGNIYLSSRTLITVFWEAPSRRAWVVCVDMADRRSRSYLIKLPWESERSPIFGSAYVSTAAQHILHIVLYGRVKWTDGDERLEFVDAKYDIFGVNRNTAHDHCHRALSSESILFPVGDGDLGNRLLQ